MPSPAPPTQRRAALALLLLGGLLAALVGGVFGPTLNYEFINYDDGPYVYENPQVSGGLTAAGVYWAFTQRHSSNWHPLTWLSHMLDCQLYGLWPGGHHLTNLVLHAATAWLLLLVLYQMTGRMGASWLVAAVFAVHPLRVESVAWIAERKDVLSGLLFMLTLLAYYAYARRPTSMVRYAATLLLYALGLMAKPMLVSVPCVLLLLDYWPLGRCPNSPGATSLPRRTWTWLLLEKLPLGLLALSSSIVTLWAQSRGLKSGQGIAMLWRLANAPVSVATYIAQLFWSPGQPFYPHDGDRLSLLLVTVALLLLLAISAACVVGRRNAPYLLVGWGWFLIMLLPVLGVVQVGTQALAERYTYLPQIGLCLLLIWGAADVLRRVKYGPYMAAIAAALIVGGLAVRAARQLPPWHDSIAFWRHVISTDPEAKLSDARYSLGVALQEHGRFEEAIVAYHQALTLTPNYAEAHNNLANVLDTCGRLPEAIEHYRQALRIDSKYVMAQYNLATALNRQGRFDESLAAFQAALTLDPDCVEAHNNLANALAEHGQIDAAVQHFERAVALRPRAAEIHYNFANLLAKADRLDAAVAHWREAAVLQPTQGVFRAALGTGFYQQGRLADAVAQWRVGLRLQPDAVDLLQQLAWVLATTADASLRNGSEALALAQRAAQLAGSASPEILDTLAAADAETGRFAEAVATAQQARDLAAGRGAAALADAIGQRMALYRQGQPFRTAP